MMGYRRQGGTVTFSVINVAENRERVVGTIWAAAETEAQQMAASLFDESANPQNERLVLRPSEPREIPLRWMN